MAGSSLYRQLSFSLIILMLVAGCDNNKELESNKVTFSGTIKNSDFSPAPNLPFQILIRTNPAFDPDTTINVRINGTTASDGRYEITIPSDEFPAVPFYAVVPRENSLMSLEITDCLTKASYLQVFPNENHRHVRFGAATFMKVICNKIDESAGHTFGIFLCNENKQTTLSKPDDIFYIKLPYDFVNNPHTLFYTISYPDMSPETRSTQLWLWPYDTTEVLIEY